jgi:hypothetical protein
MPTTKEKQRRSVRSLNRSPVPTLLLYRQILDSRLVLARIPARFASTSESLAVHLRRWNLPEIRLRSLSTIKRTCHS